jgi:hypothetical protein
LSLLVNMIDLWHSLGSASTDSAFVVVILSDYPHFHSCSRFLVPFCGSSSYYATFSPFTLRSCLLFLLISASPSFSLIFFFCCSCLWGYVIVHRLFAFIFEYILYQILEPPASHSMKQERVCIYVNVQCTACVYAYRQGGRSANRQMHKKFGWNGERWNYQIQPKTQG